MLDVTGNDNRRVLGPIVALEEFKAVVVHVGKVLDVAQKAHRRVLVSMRLIGSVAQHLVKLTRGACDVLVVLAENSFCFGLEQIDWNLQILKAVGLQHHYLIKVFF